MAPTIVPSSTKSRIEDKIIKSYTKTLDAVESGLSHVFATHWGQCTNFLQLNIEAEPGFEENIWPKLDAFALITIIQTQCQKFEGNQDQYHALIGAKARFFKMYQQFSESLQTHIDSLKPVQSNRTLWWQSRGDYDIIIVEKSRIDCDRIKSEITFNKTKDSDDEENPMPINKIINLVEEVVNKFYPKGFKISNEKFKVRALLASANWARYRGLLTDLENNFVKGQSQYPDTVAMAHNCLIYFKTQEVGSTYSV